MSGDAGDGVKRVFIAPNGIRRHAIFHPDRIIRCLALVGAAGPVAGALKRSKVYMLRRKIVDRGIGCLRQDQRLAGLRHDAAGKGDANPVRRRANEDRMIWRTCLLANLRANGGGSRFPTLHCLPGCGLVKGTNDSGQR
jgi:hypothetical protein